MHALGAFVGFAVREFGRVKFFDGVDFLGLEVDSPDIREGHWLTSDFMRGGMPVPDVALGRTETIYFAFERDRATAPDAMLLLELARLAEATPGVRITVRTYRGSTLLDNGNILTEKLGIAQQRGEKLSGILVGLGAPEGSITVETLDASANPDGEEDWQSRRAELTVSAPS